MNTTNLGLIFDFDGTLLDSISTAYRGTCHIFEQSGLTPPSFQEYYTCFGNPYRDFYTSRGVTAPDEQIWQWYFERAKHEEAEMFDDVKETLTLFHALSIPMAIVSGQRKEVLDLQCTRSGIGEFFKNVVGLAQHKVEEIRKTARLFRLPPENVLYVGDFASDMRDSIDAGVIPIGITRGHPIRENLRTAGARFCIDNLRELADIIDSLCQTSQPA